jgi:hypothetical protein
MSGRILEAMAVVAAAYATAIAGTGCSAACNRPLQKLPAGAYVTKDATSATDWHADQYRLTLSADRESVVEEFDLGGRHYRLTYASSVYQHENAM